MNSKQRFFLLILFSFFRITTCLHAQQTDNITISGQVFDSVSKNIPSNIAFFLIQNGDTLNTDIKKTQLGSFHISLQNTKDNFVLITKASFHNNHCDTLNSTGNLFINLDTIYLNPAISLDEITIESGYKSKISIDTAIFTADSFIIKRFDNIEQLLEKIPGIEIIPNVGIRYYGQSINEASIDGIPFLNFDTHTLLKLLRGRDVNKLKIYTLKTSKNSTSIVRQEKGLDICLKKEAKQGYYGKLALAGQIINAPQWENSSNLSSLHEERNIMVYANTNNTGNTSSFGDSSPSGQNTINTPHGKPVDISAGIHYNKNTLNDKWTISGNYQIGYNNINCSTEIIDITTLLNSQLTAQSTINNKAYTTKNTLAIQSSYKIKSSSYLGLAINSGVTFYAGNINSNTNSTNNENEAINSTAIQNKNNRTSFQNTFELSYSNLFTNNSTLSCTFSQYLSSANSNSMQSSAMNLFNSGNPQISEQQKNGIETNRSSILNIHYKYPLTKFIYFDLNYQPDLTKSKSLLNTFDQYSDINGETKDSLNPMFSSDYNLNKLANRFNASTSLRIGTYSIKSSLMFNQILWNQHNVLTSINQTKNFINILPSASIYKNISKNTFVGISYSSQATQPTINQIQPLVDNTNPLKIIAGNPNLVQSFSHMFGLNYTASAKNGNRILNANSNFSIIENAISSRQIIDENGRETSQYYNQDGNLLWNLSINYDMAIQNHIRLSTGLNITSNRTITIVNNEENTNRTISYIPQLSLSYFIDTTLNIRLSSELGYSLTHTTLDSQRKHIINNTSTFNIDYSLPFWGVSTGTSMIWNNTQSSDNNSNIKSLFIWNAYIQRCINKSQSLSIKIYAYDILNQNRGYLFYNENNVQHSEFFNSIDRFVLIGFIWNFTKR